MRQEMGDGFTAAMVRHTYTMQAINKLHHFNLSINIIILKKINLERFFFRGLNKYNLVQFFQKQKYRLKSVNWYPSLQHKCS